MKRKEAVPTALREFCRQAVEDAIPHMALVARGEGEKVTAAERMKAFEVLTKFGVFDFDTVLLNDEDVAQAAVQVVFEMFGGDRLEEFSERLVAQIRRERGLGEDI